MESSIDGRGRQDGFWGLEGESGGPTSEGEGEAVRIGRDLPPACLCECYTAPFITGGRVAPRNAAVVILYREDPELEVFWVRRSRNMRFMGAHYAFPGGQAEPGEELVNCAARELSEEVGVRVDPAELLPVGRWVTPAFNPRRFDTCFFLAG